MLAHIAAASPTGTHAENHIWRNIMAGSPGNHGSTLIITPTLTQYRAVPLVRTQVGLKIYREVIGRESSCAANWHKQYGPEALQKKPDMSTMINLGKFSKFASVPMPLDVQRTRQLLFVKLAAPSHTGICERDLVGVLTQVARAGMCVATAVYVRSARASQGEACSVGHNDSLREGHVPKVDRRSRVEDGRRHLG